MIFVGKMIYLSNTTDAQVAYVPRDTEVPEGATIRFTMKSTVDLDTVVDALVIDMNLLKVYFNVALTLPENTAPGEYQYELTADGDVLSTGLCIVRDNGVTVDEYNKEIEYEQYQS